MACGGTSHAPPARDADSIAALDTQARAAYLTNTPSATAEAIRLWHLAYQRSRSAHRLNAAGSMLDYIGVAFRRVGALDSAMTYFQAALKIYQTTGHNFNQATALLNLGDLFASSHQADSARRYYRAALWHANHTEDTRLQGVIRARLGGTLP